MTKSRKRRKSTNGGVAIEKVGTKLGYREAEITPEWAAELLAKGKNVRQLNRRRVLRLAEEMEAGNWDLNGESIKVDGRGRLVDGFHRLSAIVETGKPQRMSIVEGVDDVMEIDTGKPRTLTDYLKMKGETGANYLASLISRIWKHAQGETAGGIGASVKEAMEVFARNKTTIRESAAVYGNFKDMPQRGAIVFCHWLLGTISTADRDDFFAELAHPTSTKGPIFALREYLTKMKNRKPRNRGPLTKEEVEVFIIKAWNAFRTNREVHAFMYRKYGPRAEGYPEPI